jgi:tetratricopeptide (TPR) repeat protein
MSRNFLCQIFRPRPSPQAAAARGQVRVRLAILWPVLGCWLLTAAAAVAAAPDQPADQAEDVAEYAGEPELPVADTTTPRPHKPLPKPPQLEGYPGQLTAPRAYGGGRPLKRSSWPPAPTPVPEVEIANEPLEGALAAATPPPPPVRKPSTANAKQYSYSPAGAGMGAGPAGGTDPELFNAEPLAGRELKTEPLPAAVPAAGPAGGFEFRGELDRNNIHQDESFTLTVELTAQDLSQASGIRFAKPAQFDLINTHDNETRTSTQGHMLQTRTRNYVFLPLQTGSFTLPPAEVTYRGRVCRTLPLEVTVEGPRSGFGYQRQFSGRKGQQVKILPAAPDTAASSKEDTATFYANLDQHAVYVNQQATLTVRLRYLSEFGLKVVYTPPPLTGFLSETLQQTQTEANVSGARQKYLERVYRTAIFPIQPGELSVSSAQATFTKWGQTQSLSTEPLSLEVKPLPPDPDLKAGEPPSGLVGKYQLTASLLPGRYEVDAALHLRLSLQGAGNIRAAPEPTLSIDPSLRLQPESKNEQLNRDGGIVQGRRDYQYLLVPRKPGQLALGQARLRYFDPQAQAWQSAAALLPTVAVLPQAEQETVVPPSESTETAVRAALHLRPIHGGQDVLRRLDQRVLETPGFWVVPGLGAVLLGLAWFGRWWQRRTLADPYLLRARRAYTLARGALHEAHGHIRKGSVTRFYDCMSRAATEYLAAKFGVAASYIVADRLNEYFDRQQVPNAFRARFKITLTACEYVRYAAVELPTHDMRSLHRDLSAAIDEFERYWRKSRTRKNHAGLAAGWLLALVLLGGAARAGEPELYFLHGNGAFEQGQYETALAEYEKIIGLGITDPDVYYNLGNAYVKLGRIGRAILAYEKGLRLAPRDADLQHNLAETATAAVDAQPEESAVSYRGWFTRGYRFLTANELAWAASAAYLSLMLGVSLWLLWPLRAAWWRRVVLAAGVLLVLLTGWSAARYLERYWWQRAVILTPTADIVGRPYANAEKLYTLHEGTRVSIGREEEAWLEVRFGQGRRGWCARGALGMIE